MEVDGDAVAAVAGGPGALGGMGNNEPERRAYVCVGYCKDYKDAEPVSYRRIVTELHADLS